MSENKIDVEKKVMSAIKSGHIKLRSRYVFLAEKLGFGSAIVFTVVLAVLFFSLTFFYLKATDNLWYLSFGSRGLFAFLESFPYLLVVASVFLVCVAGLIIKRSGALYRRPFGFVAVGLVGFVVIVGIVLAFSDIFDGIEHRAFGDRCGGRFFKPFLHRGIEARGHGMVGRVLEVNGVSLNLQTPFGIRKVDVSIVEDAPNMQIVAGMFVMAVGEQRGDVFFARGLRLINENDMPMLGREIHRRFGVPSGTPPLCFQ